MIPERPSSPIGPVALAVLVGAGVLGSPGDPVRAQEVLRPNARVEGEIPEGGSLTYRFTAPEAGPYAFQTSGETDTVLFAFDADSGAFLGMNDDERQGVSTSLLAVDLEADRTVRLVVSGFRGAGGPFGLVTVEGGRAVPVEDAGAVSPGDRVETELPPGGQAHASFEAPEDGYYALGADVEGDLDTILHVHDADGHLRGVNDDAAADDLGSGLTLEVRSGRTVHLVVREYPYPDREPEGGTFSFTCERAPTPTALETGSEIEDEIPTGGFVRYTFEAPESGVYTFRTIPGSVDGTPTDTVLSLVDEDREVIAENDDVAEGRLGSEVVHEMEAGDVVHVLVASFEGPSGAGGPFTIRVTREGVLPPVREGQPLPPLPEGTTTIDGEPVRLEDHRGDVLLVHFWATWDDLSVRRLPSIRQVHEAFGDRGFDVLGVSLDTDLEGLRSFLEERSIPWPQICDEMAWESRYAEAYGVDALPQTILLDREGRVVAVDLGGDELRARVEELAEGTSETGDE